MDAVKAPLRYTRLLDNRHWSSKQRCGDVSVVLTAAPTAAPSARMLRSKAEVTNNLQHHVHQGNLHLQDQEHGGHALAQTVVTPVTGDSLTALDTQGLAFHPQPSQRLGTCCTSRYLAWV